MGTLIQIATKKEKRALMELRDDVSITRKDGIEEDGRTTTPKRQITVVSTGQWRDACATLKADLPWTHRRANLLVDGIRFSKETEGQFLSVGHDVILLITGETTPCSRMDEAHPGLQKALEPDWRGGVTCRVIRGGTIKVGNAVQLQPNRG